MQPHVLIIGQTSRYLPQKVQSTDYIARAHTYASQKRYHDALLSYSCALDLNPTNPDSIAGFIKTLLKLWIQDNTSLTPALPAYISVSRGRGLKATRNITTNESIIFDKPIVTVQLPDSKVCLLSIPSFSPSSFSLNVAVVITVSNSSGALRTY